MGADSKIEWTHHTFNPWWGCVRVSPGCEHCYAETFAKRTGNNVWGVTAERRFFGDKHWSEPLKWDAAAAKVGERHRVFCASMADVFEDRTDLEPQRQRLWALIDRTQNLDWLLLTKRPQNARRFLPGLWLRNPAPNVWIGCTVEDQRRAEERIPELQSTPATVRFLSCEPLLGPVEIAPWLSSRSEGHFVPFTAEAKAAHGPEGPRIFVHKGIDWVIVGGESGPGARPMHPEWARSLRKQCDAVGVAYHFKQWGDWVPGNANAFTDETYRRLKTATRHDWDDGYQSWRVGKALAGRHFDGNTWDGYPRVG